MNEQEEKVINLKRMLYKACKNWRRAVVLAAIGAVVIGGTRCAMELVKISDPEVVEARQIQYEGELAEYQQKGEEIRKSMEQYENTIIQQTDYNENSVLMQINAQNEWIGSLDFYVETDWKIMPELSYQNQNPANQIVRVYSTYITNGELYQYVIDRLDAKVEIRYLREVLGGSADSSNYLIHFSVRGASEEYCRQLLTLVEEGMRAKQPEIVTSVGEFKLLTTNSSTYSQINYSLEQSQKDNLQVITDCNTGLAAKKLEQQEWVKDEKKIKEPVINTGDAVKTGIKVAILAGVILGVLVLGYYGVKYVLSKEIQDREDFLSWKTYLVELPAASGKKAFQWVDRIIGSWFLDNVKASEYDQRIAAVARQLGEKARLSYDTKAPKLALIGDVPTEELRELAAKLTKEKGTAEVQFIPAGNLMLSSEAIEGVLTSDAVVLVAKQEYSKRESTVQMRKQLCELKKPLAAVLLTDADAMI